MAQHLNETSDPARPVIEVGVVMRREPVTGHMSRWQRWRWVLADVVPQQDLPALPDHVRAGEAVALEPTEGEAATGASHWLFPRLPVTLYRDDAEGYYLNLASPSPCFWVMWRLLEAGVEEDSLPELQVVTLSYHDAGRWLDAQERVDQVPASGPVVAWLAAFVQAHYQPEPKRRQRPASFQPLTDRFGRPASVSIGQRRGPRSQGAQGE